MYTPQRQMSITKQEVHQIDYRTHTHIRVYYGYVDPHGHFLSCGHFLSRGHPLWFQSRWALPFCDQGKQTCSVEQANQLGKLLEEDMDERRMFFLNVLRTSSPCRTMYP